MKMQIVKNGGLFGGNLLLIPLLETVIRAPYNGMSAISVYI